MKITLLLLTALTGYLISGCSSIGIGSQSFTIEGDIPANVSVEFLTQYEPLDGEGCYRNGDRVGGEVTTGNIEAKPTAQHYKVSVPLTTRIHGCKSHALGVRAVILDTRLATKQDDGLSTFAGFLGIDPYNKELLATPFNSTINMECTRYFRLNGNIQYLQECRMTDRSIQNVFSAKDLANNIVNFNVTQTKEDQPSCEKCWVKVPNGWKACISSKNLSIDASCRNPPVLRKSFEWDGKTCTIYPSCTE